MGTIVTIDGPAGAGKSTIAKLLADRLQFAFLDTGAMYRAVAWAAQDRGLPWDQPNEIAALARQLLLEMHEERIFVDGCDVSDEIRTAEVTAVTKYAANNPDVREHLVQLQREFARDLDIVSEGRDQGTVVFPHALCKFFVTASPDELRRRRQREMAAKGEHVDFALLLARQNERDRADSQRAIAPLKPAPDAITITTDGIDINEVVDRLETLVRAKMLSG